MPATILTSFAEAVKDIPDGATVLLGGFGPRLGTPANLILALRDHGVKNLTIVSNAVGLGGARYGRLAGNLVEPDILITNGQVKKVISSFPASASVKVVTPLMQAVADGKLEVELSAQGTLAERLRAGGSGIGAFYTPVGVGTILEKGKEKRVFAGETQILEHGIVADYALVKAHKADKLGNIVYRGTARTFNPLMAMAARCTIAEVREIVEPGELDAEHIVTPHIFVHRLVKIPEGGIK